MSSQSGSEFVEYDSQCYEVQCIRDRRIVKGKKQYLIKWKDWQQNFNTWEPIQNLQTVLAMITSYQRQLQGNPRKQQGQKHSQTNEPAMKKTKPIEKQKKKKRNIEEISQSESEAEVVQIAQSKEKKGKKDQKKERKSINNNQMELEREKGVDKVLAIREKEVERQKVGKDMKEKQKERQKERQKQIIAVKKSQSTSIANITKAPQPSAPVNLPKQVSKPTSEPYSGGEIIEITGINYHILIPPELPHLPAKLYYNVNRRSKITKKPLAVIDVPSQELLHKCPEMIIKHLQSFAIEVEYYSYQKKQYQNLQNMRNKGKN